MRTDQNGQSILPKKKIEIRKTRRKYFMPIGLGGSDLSVVFIVLYKTPSIF